MRFDIKYIQDPTIELFNIIKASKQNLILVLAPGDYNFNPTSSFTCDVDVFIIGDPRNTYKRTHLYVSAAFDWDSRKLLYIENLTINGLATLYTFYNPKVRVICNKIWFSTSSIMYYERFTLSPSVTDAIVKFINCRLPEPTYYQANPYTIFNTGTSYSTLPDKPDSPFVVSKCTYPMSAPQLKYVSTTVPYDQTYKLYKDTSWVLDDTPLSEESYKSGLVEISRNATVIDGQEIYPNVISNLFDGSTITHWEAKPGDYAAFDLGSSIGIRDIIIDNPHFSSFSYEIRVSTDGIKWFKVVAVSLSSEFQRIHDLYGYKSRYVLIRILDAPTETIKLSAIKIYTDFNAENAIELVPGFGPLSGRILFTERMREPLKIQGSVEDSGVPLDNNVLTFFSVNSGVVVGKAYSVGGNFELIIPDEFAGHQFEIYGFKDNKKIQISRIIAPVRDCESGYLFQCMNYQDCIENGGEWLDDICWEPQEGCEFPYYNCNSKSSCEEAGGVWWDTVRDCWGPDLRKIIGGEEKIITPSSAVKMGGYLIGGYDGEIHHSNFDDYSDTFAGTTGNPPQTNKWVAKIFNGSAANLTSYSALIDNNKLWLKCQSKNTTKTSFGIESEFIVKDSFLCVELDYSDVVIPTTNINFFFGIQNIVRGLTSDLGMKGVYINSTGIHAITVDATTVTTGTLARGTYGTLRLTLSLNSISIEAKVDTGNWVHVISTSETLGFKDRAKIRMSWTHTAVGSASIKLSNLKIIAGNFHPKTVPDRYSIALDGSSCREANGYWDNELGTCCPKQTYLIDFSTFTDNYPVNNTDSRLYSSVLPESHVVDGKFKLEDKCDANNGVDYKDGILTIEKLDAVNVYEPFEIIIDFNISRYIASASSLGITAIQPIKVILYYLDGKTTGTVSNYEIEIRIEDIPASNSTKYATYYRGLTSGTFLSPNLSAFPSSGKIKISRSYYNGPLETYYFDNNAWVLNGSKAYFTQLDSFVSGGLKLQISSYDVVARNNALYARTYTVDISTISIDYHYAPCGSCIDHPITSCITQSPCETLGGFWQKQTERYTSKQQAITYCKNTPPDCSGDNTQCYNQQDCMNSGFYWYNNTCNSTPEKKCSNTASLCLNQTDCVNSGFYWYNNICNLMIEPKCGHAYSYCKNRVACEERGGYWDGTKCNYTNVCNTVDPSKCLYQKECEAMAGHYWYNNQCNFGNNPTERALDTLGFVPTFYVNFSSSNPLIDIVNPNRTLVKSGSPILIRSELIQESGANFYYAFNSTDSSNFDVLRFDSVPVVLNLDYTIEMVIKPFSFMEKEFSVKPFGLMGDKSNKCFVSVTQFQLLLGTNDQEYALSLPISLEIDVWYHIVLTSQNNELCVFVNGQPGQTLISNGSSLQLTSIAANKYGIYKGGVDEIAIYNYAFDPQAIADRSSYVISNS